MSRGDSCHNRMGVGRHVRPRHSSLCSGNRTISRDCDANYSASWREALTSAEVANQVPQSRYSLNVLMGRGAPTGFYHHPRPSRVPFARPQPNQTARAQRPVPRGSSCLVGKTGPKPSIEVTHHFRQSSIKYRCFVSFSEPLEKGQL